MTDLKYYPKIDGLRCIAVFLILIEHVAYYIGHFISAGYYGVDLFFVISGFLVTRILLHSAGSFKESYKKFIIRRTLRIFPLYYLNVLILVLIGIPGIMDYIVSVLTYTYNYVYVAKGKNMLRFFPYWSLCVEEQFYLFWPFVVLLLRSKIKVLLGVTIFLIAVGYAQILFNVFGLRDYNYVGIMPRVSSLALGSLGAMVQFNRRIFENKFIELTAFILLATAMVFDFKLKFILFGVCSLFFVLKAAYYSFSPAVERFLTNKKVRFVGQISYGVYLWQIPVLYIGATTIEPLMNKLPFQSWGPLRKLEFHQWILYFPLYSALTIFIAWLSFKYYESIFLRLKKKFT